MGTVFTYFTGKVSSSNIQRDPVEEMAESETLMSQNDFRKYRSAFQVVQEFLDNGGNMMERQTMLEAELETCKERYDRALYCQRSVLIVGLAVNCLKDGLSVVCKATLR